MKNKMKVVKDENVGKVQVSTFRKEKHLPKHAKSTVKVYGIWKSDAHEKDFMERVVSVYANMSSEYHLYATSAGDTLTVAARMIYGGNEVSFTEYTWMDAAGKVARAQGMESMVRPYWAIVSREEIMSV